MEHEMHHYAPSLQRPLKRSSQRSSSSTLAASRALRGAARCTPHIQVSVDTLTQALERALSRLRGESLVVAMLAYGLGARLSELRALRVRDISLRHQRVMIGGRFKVLPKTALDDLREHLQEGICGREAPRSTGEQGVETIWRRDDPVFSTEAIELVSATICNSRLPVEISPESSDAWLKALGWLHRRRAAIAGLRCESALELLDKGPRIVRRGYGGSVDAYYVWRAAQELF